MQFQNVLSKVKLSCHLNTKQSFHHFQNNANLKSENDVKDKDNLKIKDNLKASKFVRKNGQIWQGIHENVFGTERCHL